MRKIVMAGVAAALALGLTACGNDAGTNAAGTPSSPAGSTPGGQAATLIRETQ